MADLKERDAMICRSCGNEERASEGYPCVNCGTFICVICSFRGIIRCRTCSAQHTEPEPASSPPREVPLIDWPEH